MTNIISKTALVLAVVTSGLVFASGANAQSSNGNQGGGNGKGSGVGQGAQGSSASGSGHASGSDNNNLSAIRKINIKNPNNNPRIPRRPKVPAKTQIFASQNSPCGVIYSQITKGNMLVMVPRYNECIRLGLEH